jgi:hypothetical protein
MTWLSGAMDSPSTDHTVLADPLTDEEQDEVWRDDIGDDLG